MNALGNLLCLKIMMYQTVTSAYKFGWWNPKVSVPFYLCYQFACNDASKDWLFDWL